MPRLPHHSPGWGGKREGAGRPPGSISKMTQLALDMVGDADEHPLQVLLRIMSDKETPLNIQAQAAASCLPFCLSRLSLAEISVSKPTDNMSVKELESYLVELGQQVLEHSPKVIEGEVIQHPTNGHAEASFT
jgi:hypothetical protein